MASAGTPRRCPTCGRAVDLSDDAAHRPFCSERCRLIDLGAWLSGQRAIPGDAPPIESDEAPEPPPPQRR